MFAHPDIRFQAKGPETARVDRLLLPLRIFVSRSTSEQALGEARRVVEQLRQAAEQFTIEGARLSVRDLASVWGKYAAEWKINQTSKKEAKLELLFFAILTIEANKDFWSRAVIIARLIDFLQRFCQQPREKDIDVVAEKAIVLDEEAVAASGPSTASASQGAATDR